MTTKQNILKCIKYAEASAILARQCVIDNDWAGAAYMIENWMMKDAKEAVQYLKNGINLKEEESNEHHSRSPEQDRPESGTVSREARHE